jgi:hypothetical protein
MAVITAWATSLQTLPQMIDSVGLHVGSTLGPAAGHTVEGRPIFHPGSGNRRDASRAYMSRTRLAYLNAAPEHYRGHSIE